MLCLPVPSVLVTTARAAVARAEAQPVSPSHHLPSPGHGGSGGGNYPNTVYYYDIPVRQPLLTQPGSAMLLPTALVNSTSITLAPITYKVSPLASTPYHTYSGCFVS